MKTFLFEATVTDPRSLTTQEQETLRRKFDELGITKLRLHQDNQGQTALEFPVEAPNDAKALERGQELTAQALAGPYTWFVGGITHWFDE